MELQTFVTIEIHTLDLNANVVKVSVPSTEDEVSVDVLHSKVCNQFGLKRSSWRHFAIFQGVDKLMKKYKASDNIVLPARGLSLRKWCLDPRIENKLLKSDSQALHLIFLQAQHDVEAGKLQPSEEQKEKLEECLDPSFMIEDQYVSICRQITNYHSVYVPECRPSPNTSIQAVLLPDVLCVFVSKHGLALTSDCRDTLFVSWFEVEHWSWNKEETTVSYSIHSLECSAPVKLGLTTTQHEYLLSATIDAIWTLMADDDDCPTFHSSMIHLKDDGSKQWDNCLYDPSKVPRAMKQDP